MALNILTTQPRVDEIFQFVREFLPSRLVCDKMTSVNKTCYALNLFTTEWLWKMKITEFVALLSVKNGMKPLKKMLCSFREILQYVRDECLGLSNLHMAA